MQAAAEKAGSNQKISAGTLVFSQGAMPNNLVLLNQGKVAIRAFDDSEDQEDISKAKFVHLIQGPAVVGASALASGKSLDYLAVATEDCVISCFPSNRDNLLKIFASKPSLAILYLRSIYKDTVETFNKVNSANSFMEQITKNQMAISLAYSVIAPEKFKDNENDEEQANLGAIDAVLPQARIIVESFIEKGGSIPSPLTEQFMRQDHSMVLGHSYDPELPIDREELGYLRRLVSWPANIQGAISQRDPQFFLMTINKLGRFQTELLKELNNTFAKIKEATEFLIVGQNSWLEKTVMDIELFQQNMITTSHSDLFILAQYLHESIRVLQEKYKRNFSLPLPADVTESFNKLTAFLTEKPEEETKPAAGEEAVEADAGDADILKEMNGMTKKVFQWASIENEKFAEFQKMMGQLKELKNPLDHEGDARKLRRGLNNLYWEVYEKAALKYLADRNDLPRFMKLFFNFGIIDEELLEEEQLLFIYKNADQPESKYSIYTALEWLEKIYDNEAPTSVNELGLTFFEILKQDNRDKNWKRESDLPADVNTPMARVQYEIKNMLSSNVKLTSGSIMNHFAVLSKHTITQNIMRSMVTKDLLEKELDTLLAVDFSAFHREILFEVSKESAKREFIQISVSPNIILVPSSGPVFQFWQDREGKDRKSPGRMLCPALAMADLYTMLLSAVAACRWETIKTILGPDWNNISKSSLTADYTDYVQFFRKNRDLTPEAKEKLAAEFKRFRDDRARFVNDYVTWIKYESEGTQRFNKVARKIFAKHIPFAKDIREKLLKLPSYADVIQKSINIRKRKARELEPRYKKYKQDSGGILAPELVETHKFYNMEY